MLVRCDVPSCRHADLPVFKLNLRFTSKWLNEPIMLSKPHVNCHEFAVWEIGAECKQLFCRDVIDRVYHHENRIRDPVTVQKLR